jgi:6-phosphogluconolactonase (cycloisomerase 2 family)
MRITLLKIALSSLAVLIFLTTSSYAQGNFIYANNGNVTGFTVGPAGSLTRIPGSPFITGGFNGSGGNDIVISPTRNLLFVSNDNNFEGSTVGVFSINPDTGFLTPVPGSPFQSGTGPVGSLSLAVTPDGKILFAANTANGLVAIFNIAPDGALTHAPGSLIQVANVGTGPIKVTPDGRFLYVASLHTGHIWGMRIASDGSLSFVPGVAFQTGNESRPLSLEINCEGTLMFATAANDIAVYNIGTDGALTHIEGSPFPFVSFGDSLALNRRDNLLYVSSISTAQISVFSVGPDGSIPRDPLTSVSIADPNDEDSRPVEIALNRTGTLLYAMSANNTTHVFNIASAGSILPVPGSPFQGGGGYGTMYIAFPQNDCLAAPNFDLCIQDDNSGKTIKINSETGDYFITNGNGFSLGGRGTLQARGCVTTLEDSRPDRRLQVKINTCSKKGVATLQMLSPRSNLTITDRNITNNSCSAG